MAAAAASASSKDVKSSSALLLQTKVQGPSPAPKPRADEKLSLSERKLSSSPPSPRGDAFKPGLKVPTEEILKLLESDDYGVSTSELKHIQLTLQGGSPATAAGTTPTSLNNISPGTDYNQRVGRQIRLHHLTIRGHINWQLAATTTTAAYTDNPVRIVVLRDRMPIAAQIWATTPSGAISVDNTSYVILMNSGGPSGNSTAPTNINTHGFRYEVLHDEVHANPASTVALLSSTTYVGMGSKMFHIHIDLKRVKSIYYDDTAGADLMTNEIVLYYMQDGNPSGWTPIIDWTSDLAFSDN